MRLFEAILEANHRAVAGDVEAGLRPTDYADELPIIALTCIDPRLNRLMPGALGVPEESFIWLRNAGNIITHPLSSTMRSLALACAVKGGREIAIIGHTDCHVATTTMLQLLDRFKALGIERNALPDNVNEYFGLFATERQNVIKGYDLVRRSPIIGAKIPVHGLLVDIETGKLEWVVNGYQSWQNPARSVVIEQPPTAEEAPPLTGLPHGFEIGEMKFPETKIGEATEKAKDWLTRTMEEVKAHVAAEHPPTPPPVPPPIQNPPRHPLRMKTNTPAPIQIKGNFPHR